MSDARTDDDRGGPEILDNSVAFVEGAPIPLSTWSRTARNRPANAG